ncbi:hypothetical protein AB6H46_22780 [Vibrio alginolyticus]|uniref:hypothetical protein n=1 Tax=Vibrio alginolyticus TaxID=663 RepID=UPI0035545B4C
MSVGVAQYVPELNAAVGYLQNNRNMNMKIAISVKPQNPTVHLVIGHKSNVEKNIHRKPNCIGSHRPLYYSSNEQLGALYVVVLV